MSVARHHLIVAALLLASLGTAGARLPPPTPEQQQQAAQKKAEAAAEAREQQEALTRVQDRIAADYIAARKAKGIIVTPTPVVAQQAAREAPKEVPSAALENRPAEKSGAYSEQVSPESARTSAGEGSSPKAGPERK